MAPHMATTIKTATRKCCFFGRPPMQEAGMQFLYLVNVSRPSTFSSLLFERSSSLRLVSCDNPSMMEMPL